MVDIAVRRWTPGFETDGTLAIMMRYAEINLPLSRLLLLTSPGAVTPEMPVLFVVVALVAAGSGRHCLTTARN